MRCERRLAVDEQKPVPLVYEEVKLECGYRMDLLVEQAVVVDEELSEPVFVRAKGTSLSIDLPPREAQRVKRIARSNCPVAKRP